MSTISWSVGLSPSLVMARCRSWQENTSYPPLPADLWPHLGEDGALSEAGLQRLEHGGDGLQLGAGELVRVVRDALVNLNTHTQLPL